MVRAESCRGLELTCGEYGNAPEHRRDLHRPCRICFLDQQGWAWQKEMPRSARNMPRSIRRLTRARNVGASLYVLMPDTYLQRCPTETLQLTSSESAGTCFCKVERSGLMRKRKEPTYSLASIQKSRRLTVSFALYVPFFETLRSIRKLPSPSCMSDMTRLLRQL